MAYQNAAYDLKCRQFYPAGHAFKMLRIFTFSFVQSTELLIGPGRCYISRRLAGVMMSSTTNEINRRCILYATPMMAEEHLFVVPLLPLRAHTHRTNCIDFVSWSWHDAHKIMSVLFLTGSELSFSYLVVWQRSCYGFFKAYYYLYNLCICQIRKNIGWIFCSFYWLH